jgi:hypothetical protein
MIRFSVGFMPASRSLVMRELIEGYTLYTEIKMPMTEAMADKTYVMICQVVVP